MVPFIESSATHTVSLYLVRREENSEKEKKDDSLQLKGHTTNFLINHSIMANLGTLLPHIVFIMILNMRIQRGYIYLLQYFLST